MGAPTDFSRAQLQGSDFSGSVLSDVKAKSANFQWAKLSGTIIQDGDFRGADFRNISPPFPSFADVWIDDSTLFSDELQELIKSRGKIINGEDGKQILNFNGMFDVT